MNTLKVYGKKENENETLIFGMLADTPASRANAKRNAAAHGYTITKVYRAGSLATRYADVEIPLNQF